MCVCVCVCEGIHVNTCVCVSVCVNMCLCSMYLQNDTHVYLLAPVLDQCLQTWSTPVLGPLWVSKGEGFSPKGVEEFLKGLIAYTRAKLKEAKHYKEQV